MNPRVAAGLVGAVLLTTVWAGAPGALAATSFAWHMANHMTIVAIAAPLLALALTAPRIDPVRRAPHLFSPIAASFIEFAVVWAWHMPEWHEAARRSALVHGIEQASFLGSGLLLWIAVLGGSADQRRERAGASVLALVLTFAHMTMLGALIALSPRPLYQAHASHASLMIEHQWGGTIMLIVGAVSYLAAAMWSARLLLSLPVGERR